METYYNLYKVIKCYWIRELCFQSFIIEARKRHIPQASGLMDIPVHTIPNRIRSHITEARRRSHSGDTALTSVGMHGKRRIRAVRESSGELSVAVTGRHRTPSTCT